MESRLAELERKVALKCLQCPKLKSGAGRFECGRRRSQCHLKSVRKWLKEIEEMKRAETV